MTIISRNPDELMPWDTEPRRNSGPSTVGELDRDTMECGDPEDAFREMIKHFRWRAGVEYGIARELRQTAEAAAEDATIHATRAEEFTRLAEAMERAPVTFAAIADTHPKDGDVKQARPVSGGGAEGNRPKSTVKEVK